MPSGMELPLAFIGWFFALFSAAALVLGAVLIFALATAKEGQRNYLTFSFWNDALLAGIWGLGLAGGIGVLRVEAWGRYLLELFCWALIVLVLLSTATRLHALSRPREGELPVNWVRAIAGATLVVVPIVAICAATIVTLRSPETMQVFRGR
jgi:cell division protein FtsW (lipid II flippase)